jgi:hypothetical protein
MGGYFFCICKKSGIIGNCRSRGGLSRAGTQKADRQDAKCPEDRRANFIVSVAHDVLLYKTGRVMRGVDHGGAADFYKNGFCRGKCVIIVLDLGGGAVGFLVNGAQRARRRVKHEDMNMKSEGRGDDERRAGIGGSVGRQSGDARERGRETRPRKIEAITADASGGFFCGSATACPATVG